MAENNDNNLTDKNLDRLSDFLNQELANPTLALQIPDGSHIFHGSYNDRDLTQGNLNLAAKLLLGMTLGSPVRLSPTVQRINRSEENITNG